jgi:hypothetical protein
MRGALRIRQILLIPDLHIVISLLFAVWRWWSRAQ